MSEEIKMSDVFTVPVYGDFQDVYIIHRQKPCIVSGTTTVLVARQKHIDAVIHAINNHDRLIEENKRLRDMLNRLISHDNCRKDVIHLMSEAESLLSELGGE